MNKRTTAKGLPLFEVFFGLPGLLLVLLIFVFLPAGKAVEELMIYPCQRRGTALFPIHVTDISDAAYGENFTEEGNTTIVQIAHAA